MNIENLFEKSNLLKQLINFFHLLFGEKNIQEFENKLFLNDFITTNFEQFILFTSIFGGILSIICMVILFYSGVSYEKFVIIGFLIFFVPTILFYLIHDILFERNKRKKTDILPELILEVSVFVDQMSILGVIKKISEMEFSLISKDFEFINKQIKNGEDLNKAIEKIKQMNKSSELSRFFDILLQGYNSGGKLSKLLNELAEESLQNKAIIRERQAVMLVTKYTLLLASVLIVPIILGLIVTLVSSFNFSFSESINIGLSQLEREELFNFAVLGVRIYIIEYALISSFFLSIQDGNKKNFFIYAIILAPLATISFFIGTII